MSYRFLLIGFTLALAAPAVAQERITYQETREPCTHFDKNKQPLFGDLHVHTSYSFDSYISSQRNDPYDAYRFAKGEAISIPAADGAQTITAQLERPLDFTAVTDHAEFLGPISICTQDSSKLGYWWPLCIMTRANHYWTQLIAASQWTKLGGLQAETTEHTLACSLSDCNAAEASAWQEIQAAAEQHYDRSSDCSFTTFVGYEYTDAPDAKNMHRNVIFRNATVTPKPISTYDTGRGNFPKLWEQLRDQCIDSIEGCDVISIPHNSNLAGGLMFRDPETQQELEDRLFFEPVIELIQHKGASECRFDKYLGIGLDTTDELCNFEQIFTDNLTMLGSVHGKVRTEKAAPVSIDEFARRNMVRNALKDGLVLEKATGTNPFVMGFIGSTDTHSATPGAAEETPYLGHLGRRDSEFRNVQDHFFSNPGGHAVVWAEENSRDAIFNALKRKETYATSGTRPIVRFFAAEEFDKQLCDNPNWVGQAYADGVPMGGELNLSADVKPMFVIAATKDPGTQRTPSNDLQRIQIIKGWIDQEGYAQEKVVDVISSESGMMASVDPNTCAPVGQGASSLCTVWQDPDFVLGDSNFYYARVLETPSCRWSTRQCQAAGVNPFAQNCVAQAAEANQVAHENGAQGPVYDKCCIDPNTESFYTPTIQERAWTSPIWVKHDAN